MKNSTATEAKQIIVAFHIGRGGRFNNGGHTTYIGEKNFQDLIRLNSANVFKQNRDENGKFCKPYLTDSNGNFITDDDLNSLVGKLEFDTIYDTDYCKNIEDCTDEEIEVIRKSSDFKSYELEKFLQNRE